MKEDKDKYQPALWGWLGVYVILFWMTVIFLLVLVYSLAVTYG